MSLNEKKADREQGKGGSRVYKDNVVVTKQTASSLQSKLRAEGISQINVVGLTSRNFLLASMCEKGWKKYEDKFFEKWFGSLRKFVDKDLIDPRTVWLQTYGIPMNVWLEENLKGYTRWMGDWISWSYQKDNESEFFNPVICISTERREKIEESMNILMKGKLYPIKFVDISNFEKLENKMGPMSLTDGEIISKVRKEDGRMESKDKDLNVVNEVEFSQVEESNSVVVSNGSKGCTQESLFAP
ncbi:hypothetical protein AgCh_024530 [Apium graveolens]